jgi:hypothetical protein
VYEQNFHHAHFADCGAGCISMIQYELEHKQDRRYKMNQSINRHNRKMQMYKISGERAVMFDFMGIAVSDLFPHGPLKITHLTKGWISNKLTVSASS